MPDITYADEGTIAHALAAMCLREGTDAASYVGRVIESEDYEHAALSPSGAHRWMACIGSHALEHADRSFVERKFSMEVTEEMAEGVQTYLDNLRAYFDDLTGREGHLRVEESVPVGHITGEEGATGSADAIVIFDDEIQVHDLKFGRGVEVSAEGNEQMMLYALGVWKKLAHPNMAAVNRIRLVIHQPRIKTAPDEWEISVSELLAFAEKANERALLALHAKKYADNWIGKDNSYLTPGEKQCKFCNAKATCPALAKFVSEEIDADFEVLRGDYVDSAEAARQLLDTTTPNNTALSSKMAAIDLIENWCRAVRAKVEAELLAGREVPDWKLVQGRKGNRAWTDADRAEATLKAMRLKKEEMYDFKLISPTSAEKLLGDTPKRWKRVAPLIGQTEGKPSVAPATDKRPALVIGKPEDDFEIVASEEGSLT